MNAEGTGFDGGGGDGLKPLRLLWLSSAPVSLAESLSVLRSVDAPELR